MSWAHSSESEQSIQGLDRSMESGEREDDVNLQEDEGEAVICFASSEVKVLLQINNSTQSSLFFL